MTKSRIFNENYYSKYISPATRSRNINQVPKIEIKRNAALNAMFLVQQQMNHQQEDRHKQAREPEQDEQQPAKIVRRRQTVHALGECRNIPFCIRGRRRQSINAGVQSGTCDEDVLINLDTPSKDSVQPVVSTNLNAILKDLEGINFATTTTTKPDGQTSTAKFIIERLRMYETMAPVDIDCPSIAVDAPSKDVTLDNGISCAIATFGALRYDGSSDEE